jgi:hypothetical protein
VISAWHRYQSDVRERSTLIFSVLSYPQTLFHIGNILTHGSGENNWGTRLVLADYQTTPGPSTRPWLAVYRAAAEAPSRQPCRPNEAWEAIAMMGTVLFTDHDIVVIAIVSSSIALVLAVLAVSMGVEQCIRRLESKIRQAMWSDVNHQ